jgi:hypothetical protein
MSILLSNTGVSAIQVLSVGSISTGASSPQTASITFSNDGYCFYDGGNYNWFKVVTLNVGNDYEVFAEVTGTPPAGSFSGTLDSWLTLPRTWSLSVASGSDTGQLLIKIRKKSETVVMAEGTTTFTVEVVA